MYEEQKSPMYLHYEFTSLGKESLTIQQKLQELIRIMWKERTTVDNP